MSFDNLKRNRGSNIAKLVAAAGGESGNNEKKSYVDDRIWKPTVDKAGNGYAVCCGSCLLQKVLISLGQDTGIMGLKVQPDNGTSRSH